MNGILAHEWALFSAIHGHPLGAATHAVMVAILSATRRDLLWGLCCALALLTGGRRGRRIAVTAAFALLLAALFAWGLQGLVQRPGPAVAALPGFGATFSFPSSRTAAAFAFAPFFGRGRMRLPVWLLAGLCGYADVYSGAHYPSDAVGGALVGLLGAACAVWILGTPFRRRGVLVPLRGRSGKATAPVPAGGRRRRRAPPTRPGGPARARTEPIGPIR